MYESGFFLPGYTAPWDEWNIQLNDRRAFSESLCFVWESPEKNMLM